VSLFPVRFAALPAGHQVAHAPHKERTVILPLLALGLGVGIVGLVIIIILIVLIVRLL
jgi:uncharacterized iron-regulated membrane protein